MALTRLLWVGLLCVIGVYPDHTHFLSNLDNFGSGSVPCILFWYPILCVLSSFAIILKGKSELVALNALYACY